MVGQGQSAERNDVRQLEVRVVRSYPHDRAAYTQGLLWWQGSIYESTGRYGESTLRRYQPGAETPKKSIALPDHLFAEGLARVGERLFQLTWREHLALVYRTDTLEVENRFRYQGEGWGLCFDGQELIMSDGSSVLTYRDPETFTPTRRLEVTLNGEPVGQLNELESAEGWIFANVWMSERILRIDPQRGVVTGVIDAARLLTRKESRQAEVLNGIAYNPQTETFFLTGKLWPRLFEVVFIGG